MIAVSDTTPLNYLILIEAEGVLPSLFTTVYITPAIVSEMSHHRAPDVVRAWVRSLPPWVVVEAPTRIDPGLPPNLHRGEAEALSLAMETGPDWVLLDDRSARRAARDRGMSIAGTPNLLEEAAVRGLLAIEDAIDRLRGTNFRATEAQYRAILENVARRRADPPPHTS
ncbi:hypothetical protein [Paludisphaera sp.]|uniref:hypothetical protein n=1 Tax=Paludisphaera sp. TaxID=2017432 RepID=UPI00301C473D